MANQNGNSNVAGFRTATEDPAELMRTNGILAKRVAIQRWVIRGFSVTMILPFICWAGFRIAAWQSMESDCASKLEAAYTEQTSVDRAYENTNKVLQYVARIGGVRYRCSTVFQSSSCDGNEEVADWVDQLTAVRDHLQTARVASTERETAWQKLKVERAQAGKEVTDAEQKKFEVGEAAEGLITIKSIHDGIRTKNNLFRIPQWVPSGLSVYPFNGAVAMWGAVSFLIAAIAIAINFALRALAPDKEAKEAERQSRVKTPQRVATTVAGAANSNGNDEDDDESSGTRRTA